MKKIICPFLGFQKNEDRFEKSCLGEKCIFFNGSVSLCVLNEIGVASREYLASIQKVTEQNQLSVIQERASKFSETERQERAQLYSSQASIFLTQGDLEKALFEFRKALILSPEDPKLLTSLGDIFSMQGVHDEAIAAFRNAIKVSPENGEIWIKLILQYRGMFAHLPHRETFFAEQKEKLREDLKSIQDSSIANCIMGYVVLILHSQDAEKFRVEREEAKILMERALEADIGNLWAYLGIKDLAIMEKNFELAIDTLLQGLKAIPENPRLYFELGECYLVSQLGRATMDESALQKAMESYKSAIKLDPLFAPAYFRLGFVYEQKPNYEQAFDYYKRGLALNPLNLFAHFRLGKVYCINGMNDMAIKHFREVINLSQRHHLQSYQEGYIFNKMRLFKEANALGAWIELGNIYTRRRQFTEAEEAFQKAIAIDNSSPLAIVNLIDLIFQQNKDNPDSETIFDRLIEKYKAAALVDSQSPIAHFSLGYACQVLKSKVSEKWEERQEQAIMAYQMAINLDPSLKWAYWGLKDAYLNPVEGMSTLFEEALDACKKVVEMDPEDPKAYFEIGEVYQKMGQEKEAFSNFVTATQKDIAFIPAYFKMA